MHRSTTGLGGAQRVVPDSQVTIWRIPTDHSDSVRLLNSYWGTAAPWLSQCKYVLPLYGGAYKDRHALLVRGRFHSSLAAKMQAGGVRWAIACAGWGVGG